MRRTVPPSAEIEAQIDQLLAVGVGENPREALSALAKLGARLIIQRAVEDEFDAWLGRARYRIEADAIAIPTSVGSRYSSLAVGIVRPRWAGGKPRRRKARLPLAGS